MVDNRLHTDILMNMTPRCTAGPADLNRTIPQLVNLVLARCEISPL